MTSRIDSRFRPLRVGRLLARPVVAAAVAAGMALSAASGLLADATRHVPSEALVVFKVNNLETVSGKLGNYAREWGLAEADGRFADPLRSLQDETGIEEGLRKDGDLVVYVVMSEADDDEEAQPQPVLLIPVDDYDAFLENFDDVEKDGDFASGKIRQGDDAFFYRLGDYVLMTPERDLAREPSSAIDLGGKTQDRLESRDAIVYANFKELGPKLKQLLDENKENAQDELLGQLDEMEDQDQAQRLRPAAEAAVKQLFNVAESFFRDADAATIAFDFGDDGIGFDVVSQFEDDSYLADAFSDFEKYDDSFVDGLPQGTYLIYGGGKGNADAVKKLFDDLVKPVEDELEGEEGEKLKQYLAQLRQGIGATEGTRFGLLAPRGPLGGSALIQQVLIQEGDVGQLREAQKAQIQLQPQLAALFGAEDQAPQVTVQENAKQVGGVSFDRISIDFGQQQGMAQMQMNFMFGPEGPVSFLGEVDGKLVTVSGLTDQQIGEVVEAVRTGRTELARSQGVQEVSAKLPTERAAVVYLQVDEFVRTGLNYARQFGLPANVQIPDDLAPVGVAVTTDDETIEITGFVAKDLVSALVVASLQLQQAMGGGPGGGL